ncbi:MAG: polysaccharide pyruvyl transferase family protein [Minisyncoccia bacterium]
MVKLYWHKTNNFGDAISPVILGHFLKEKILFADRETSGKMISTGSVLFAMQENDTIWGTGAIQNGKMRLRQGVKFLAVRGPWTWMQVIGETGAMTYGDPGILLPLIYAPLVEKKYKVGVIPHYIDKEFVKSDPRITKDAHVINIQAEWKEVVKEILSCEMIVSSSLHGIICAEAYGIPAMWAVYTDKIIGGEFKFQDYFLGTGRNLQKPFSLIPPIQRLEIRQNQLIKVLKTHYGK